MNRFTSYIASTSVFLFTFLFIPCISYSQNQPNIPKPRGPIDFTETSNLVIFVVIPAIIIIAFLIFRSRIRKVKQEKMERMREERKNEQKRNN